jgi:dihydroorotase
MVGFAKSRGLPVTCEVTPHHFAVCDEDMPAYDANYKMKPPLRGRADVEAMLDGISQGVVDALATDHAPHPGSEKMQEFEKCPFGILGLETAVGLTIKHLVQTGRISVERMIELYTVGPARALGLQQGTLSVGADADLTVIDESVQWIYDVNRSPSKSRNTPFDGARFSGGPVATMVRGNWVWQRSW